MSPSRGERRPVITHFFHFFRKGTPVTSPGSTAQFEITAVTDADFRFTFSCLSPHSNFHWGVFDEAGAVNDNNFGPSDPEGELRGTSSNLTLPGQGRVWIRLYRSVDWPAGNLTPTIGRGPLVERLIQLVSPTPPAPAPASMQTVRLARSDVRPTADTILSAFVRQAADDRRFDQYLDFVQRTIAPTGSRPGQLRAGTYQQLMVATGEFLAQARINAVDTTGSYLVGDNRILLPYIDTVVRRYQDARSGPDPLSNIDPDILSQPFPVELIWSYWQEEGGLVQALNLILARFQNRRVTRGPDPLARFDLSPLRPLRSILFDWAEDEINRLTVKRRAAEYEYEYGLQLIGDAIPGSARYVESRERFLEAFHSLLFEAHRFFRLDDDTTVNADAFPVLNALRDTHLVLAEGAHNQYGDLPTQARIQMLVMQWILAQPEMREFLGGRPMVPYQEPWMDRIDSIRAVCGWGPTSVTHFHELAVLGEQLLLTVRYGNWNDLALGSDNAANWARAWRNEIQRYTLGYRAATGIDLTEAADTRMPGVLLARRESRSARRA